ncbi:MAG TPA: amidohydrolase family protein [Chloroflexota bacterium]|nr:amidohydrolase family protein [Chloroflexota bacterium]
MPITTKAGYRVIDTHVHVWPLDDAPGHRPVPGAKVRAPEKAAPVEWLVEDMEEFGMEHQVLVQSSAFGWDNTYMVECLDKYPGKFKAIGLVDPESPTNARDLESWMARGLSGFRFHPLYYDKEPRGPWWVDAKENEALWDAANQTGAIMQFHMWPKHATALARMIERHPDVRVIVDHIGKPDVTEPAPYPSFDPVLKLADYTNVYAKIGDYQIASKQQYPWRDTWPFVRLLADRFGARRMMWGTGYPRTARLVPLEQALRFIQEDLPLSDDERRQILWDTPKQLFGF